MRVRLGRALIVFATTILLDYVLALASMGFASLPPARYGIWMRLLEGPCASKLQLEIINAGMQWYAGPVVVGIAAAIAGMLARLIRWNWIPICSGAAAAAIVKGVIGSFDAPLYFSIGFAVVCAAGGGTMIDIMRGSRSGSAGAVASVSAVSPENPTNAA